MGILKRVVCAKLEDHRTTQAYYVMSFKKSLLYVKIYQDHGTKTLQEKITKPKKQTIYKSKENLAVISELNLIRLQRNELQKNPLYVKINQDHWTTASILIWEDF